jgi:hypothetical protein
MHGVEYLLTLIPTLQTIAVEYFIVLIGNQIDYEWLAGVPIASVVAHRSGHSGCLGQG